VQDPKKILKKPIQGVKASTARIKQLKRASTSATRDIDQ
jgi:hypothetical protein